MTAIRCKCNGCGESFMGEIKEKHYRGYVEKFLICPKCSKINYIASRRTYRSMYDEFPE